MTRDTDDEPVRGAEPDDRRPRARRTGLALYLGLGMAAAATFVLAAPSVVEAMDRAGVYEAIRSSAQRQEPHRVAPFRGFFPRPQQELRVLPRRGWGPTHAYAPREHQTIPDAAPEPAPAPRRVIERRPTSSSAGERTVCVRMCDGYQFPLGELQSRRDLPLHQRACMSACPGAPVKLFTVAAGAETIADARAKDGQRYGDLPMAYAYQKGYDSTCSCQGPNRRVAPRVPITADMTLRRGDLVVTNDGVLVFNGKHSRKGLTMAAFDDFRESRALSRSEKQRVDAMFGLSNRQVALKEFKRSLEAGDPIDVTHTGSIAAQ